jgi:DNA anti-recombination protein RmuC
MRNSHARILTGSSQRKKAVCRDIEEKAGAAPERAIRFQAKKIYEKYVEPPYTTDFAILYLPTEGLCAEVIPRPGLVRDLQDGHRIMVQGPSTLAASLPASCALNSANRHERERFAEVLLERPCSFSSTVERMA